MDPDVTLTEIRDLLDGRMESAGYINAEDILERVSILFNSLDYWLSAGGFLPADWDKYA